MCPAVTRVPHVFKSSNNKLPLGRALQGRMFQNIGSADASTSSPITTLMQQVSLQTQNIKVVDIFLIVLQNFESSQSELR